MADGTDEEAAHAARMDEWVVWETRRGREECGGDMNLPARVLFLFFSFVCCMGVLLPPNPAHSAPWRAWDLICGS